jgi:DNA mismatch endonuclease (patch repair protein)
VTADAGLPGEVAPGDRALCGGWRIEDIEASWERPQSNEEFWQTKLNRNVDRDAANLAALGALGWEVLTIWQCELKNREALDRRLRDFLSE